jgi:hypothetical protein
MPQTCPSFAEPRFVRSFGSVARLAIDHGSEYGCKSETGFPLLRAAQQRALGKPVLRHLRPEAVRQTEAAMGVEVPIVSVTKETLRDRIAELAAAADERQRLGASARLAKQ